MLGRSKAACAAVVACLLAAPACRRGAPAPDGVAADQPVLVGAESLSRVAEAPLESGPDVSGTLRARREAALRAELGGSVVAVEADRGQAVARGQVLARIDPANLEQQLAAARSSVASARNAAAVAGAEAERARTLSRAGAMAPRDAERADAAVDAARAQVADAQSRLAGLVQQSGKTRVRAPFAGVVAERQVSTGDVVAAGASLFTVVDPTRLQLEASVPAARVGDLRIGATVTFRVTGFGDERFEGAIERINPVVDAATGQVRIYADVPNPDRRLVAGLYAYGRVAVVAGTWPAAPASTVAEGPRGPAVLRVREGKAEEVPVKVAIRDELRDAVGFGAGVAPGDLLVSGPARTTLADGTPVRVQADRAAPPAQARDGQRRPTDRPPD